MATTKIEWCEKSWNPVTGCTKISPGCKNCYADRMSKRLAGRFGYPKNEPFKVTLHPDKLSEPKKWRKPSRIFVCSMGDLLHEDVPLEFLWQIFDVIHSEDQHKYLILTKRPDRMLEFYAHQYDEHGWGVVDHVWLGVTAENQEQADKRIPILLKIPAAVRFISIEPMLTAVDLREMHVAPENQKISLIIVGCESGPKRRPCKIEWVRSVVEQCREASVPVFVKQLDIDGKVSKDMNDWPEDLRIRQYPKDDVK